MYKYLLCWRYLRTKYIALASVISVMLGVATMIVVNSVMAGFGEKMRDRLHGVLADVVVESVSLDGFYNWKQVMARVNEIAGDQVIAQAPTMETPGILHFRFPGGQVITKPVDIIGIQARGSGQDRRFRRVPGRRAEPRRSSPRLTSMTDSSSRPPAYELLKALPEDDKDPMTERLREELKNQMREQAPDEGTILGYAIATHHRGKDLPDHFIAPPGTKVGLLFPVAGRTKAEGGYDTFTVVGYFKSGMSEYDSTHVYVPLERLQEQRKLKDVNRRGAVNQIQIKVKPGVSLDQLADEDSNRPRRAPSRVLPRLHLGTKARAALGRGRDRAEHPQYLAVLHHRRGGVRHPGDLLDDRRGKDARYRRHEGPGGIDRGHPGHLPRLRPLAGRGRQRRGDGRGAVLRPLHQRDRERPEHRHAPQGLRRHDLLLRQDPDGRPAVHGVLDRDRGALDRRDGQHLARPASGPSCTRSSRSATNEPRPARRRGTDQITISADARRGEIR